jgi:hypothetical protein
MANYVETVDLPTPPFPDKTIILCLILDNFWLNSLLVSINYFLASPLPHKFWFGHPEQPESLPALSFSTPGHYSFEFTGIVLFSCYWSMIIIN